MRGRFRSGIQTEDRCTGHRNSVGRRRSCRVGQPGRGRAQQTRMWPRRQQLSCCRPGSIPCSTLSALGTLSRPVSPPPRPSRPASSSWPDRHRLGSHVMAVVVLIASPGPLRSPCTAVRSVAAESAPIRAWQIASGSLCGVDGLQMTQGLGVGVNGAQVLGRHILSRGAGMLPYTPLERDLDWLPELPGCPGKV